MLADVGHFEHVAVQAGALHRPAEGRLMDAGAARGDDHAVELVLVDGRLDGRLSRLGAGIHDVLGQHHIREHPRILGHLGAVHGAGDIAAAMADEDAYSHALSPSGALL